jgi:hypothetical protein
VLAIDTESTLGVDAGSFSPLMSERKAIVPRANPLVFL